MCSSRISAVPRYVPQRVPRWCTWRSPQIHVPSRKKKKVPLNLDTPGTLFDYEAIHIFMQGTYRMRKTYADIYERIGNLDLADGGLHVFVILTYYTINAWPVQATKLLSPQLRSAARANALPTVHQISRAILCYGPLANVMWTQCRTHLPRMACRPIGTHWSDRWSNRGAGDGGSPLIDDGPSSFGNPVKLERAGSGVRLETSWCGEVGGVGERMPKPSGKTEDPQHDVGYRLHAFSTALQEIKSASQYWRWIFLYNEVA